MSQTKAERAKQLFGEGYNCAQAVLCAFADECGLDEETAYMLSSSFGGGLGRMREVCGAVSGMSMAAGLLYGYKKGDAPAMKGAHYKRIQELAAKFREENGSIICRELLEGVPHTGTSPEPEARTPAYYKKRPCAELVAQAAHIMEEYMKENEK